MLFVEPNGVPLALLELQHVLDLVRVVDQLLRAVVYELHVGFRNAKVPAKDYLLDRENLRVELRAAQEFVKIANVLNLAGLGNPIALLLKAFAGVVVHDFLFVLKDAHEEEEAADDCSSASLAMVTMEYRHTLSICA